MDNGAYASLDGGKTWEIFSQIPNVASYDMIVHPRENELVVATHGRSIYVADIKPLQEIAGPAKSIAVFKPESIKYQDNWGEKRYPYLKPNTPLAPISFYVSGAANIDIEIKNEDGTKLRSRSISAQLGFNTYTWDLKKDQYDKRGRKESADAEYIQKGY